MWKLLRRSPLADALRSNYPQTPEPLSPGLFGPPRIDFSRCTGCRRCVSACPTTALTARPHPGEPSGTLLLLSLTNCLFCEKCQEACTENAIQPENTFEIAARERARLEQVGLLLEEADADALHSPDPNASLRPLVERVKNEANGLFKRSLRLFALNAGSCGGCEEELFAAADPCYDFARLGVDLVDSPRHADALFVTGPVTRNLADALREVYEAVPEPRLVIAAGACAGDGNVFRGSYATLGSLDRVLPVDVYLPGCPPTPQAILHGLLLAMERAEERLTRVEYAAPGLHLSPEALSALAPPRAAAPEDTPVAAIENPAPPFVEESPAEPSPQDAALPAPVAEVKTSSYSVSSEHKLPAISIEEAEKSPTPPAPRVKTLPWMGAMTHIPLDDPPAPQDAPPQYAATPPSPEPSAPEDPMEDIPTLSGSKLIPSLSALSQSDAPSEREPSASPENTREEKDRIQTLVGYPRSSRPEEK